MLLSCVTIAFYYVWSVELARKYGSGPLAAWSTLFGFVALLPWTGWEASRASVDFTVQGLAVAAYLGIFVTVAGFFLWLHLLRTVPASTAASVQYLQPIIGIAASAAIFGDKLGLLFLVGVILVLCGLALTMTVQVGGGRIVMARALDDCESLSPQCVALRVFGSPIWDIRAGVCCVQCSGSQAMPSPSASRW
jgi:hypothetical protein